MMIVDIMQVNDMCSYEECCARSMYQGQGQEITSHIICGM